MGTWLSEGTHSPRKMSMVPLAIACLLRLGLASQTLLLVRCLVLEVGDGFAETVDGCFTLVGAQIDFCHLERVLGSLAKALGSLG